MGADLATFRQSELWGKGEGEVYSVWLFLEQISKQTMVHLKEFLVGDPKIEPPNGEVLH